MKRQTDFTSSFIFPTSSFPLRLPSRSGFRQLCLGRGGLFAEQSLDDLIAGLQSLRELLRLGAAALCHVGLTAAAAADDGGQLLDDAPRGDALREVGRGADDERRLAVGAASEDDDARLDLREQRVRELA